MKHLAICAALTAVASPVASAQAQVAPAPSAFFSDCLKSGGAPANVGDYPNIIVMFVYNGKAAATATPLRFQITAAPTAAPETTAVFEREPTPTGEAATFSLRQGQSVFVSATRLKFLNTYGGKMELCFKQF